MGRERAGDSGVVRTGGEGVGSGGVMQGGHSTNPCRTTGTPGKGEWLRGVHLLCLDPRGRPSKLTLQHSYEEPGPPMSCDPHKRSSFLPDVVTTPPCKYMYLYRIMRFSVLFACLFVCQCFDIKELSNSHVLISEFYWL